VLQQFLAAALHPQGASLLVTIPLASMVHGHGRAHRQVACGQVDHCGTGARKLHRDGFRQSIHQGTVPGQGDHKKTPGPVPAGHQLAHPIRQDLLTQLPSLPLPQPEGCHLHGGGEAGRGDSVISHGDRGNNSERNGSDQGGRATDGQEPDTPGRRRGPSAASVEVMELSPPSDVDGAPSPFRSGFVALIGRPNVGKSTLLNQLVGEKVAITSPVAQTTRNRLRAILTTPQAQLVLLDTPGIHKPHHLLGQRLVQSARGAIGEVDVVLLLVDGSQPAGRGDAFIVELLSQSRTPVHLALNKADQVAPDQQDDLLASYQALLAPALAWPLHRCSALTGAGCPDLVEALAADLPPGPHLYPADAVSDQPEQLLLGELIREQVLHHTREEVPHSVAVRVERIVEDGPRTAVLATVVVERSSQKGILIGKGGQMLRTIGQGARLQMQKVFDGPVYLELFVKVVPNWRSHPGRLAELGYRGD